MGKDYDDDYPFKRVERPYEDKNQVGYYYKPTKEELASQNERNQLYWWEQQKGDLSEWRKNYMRTLELRTLNAKRVLKLNVNKDVEKINSEVQEQQKSVSPDILQKSNKMSRNQTNNTSMAKIEIESNTAPPTLVNENRYNHVGLRSVASRPNLPTFAGG